MALNMKLAATNFHTDEIKLTKAARDNNEDGKNAPPCVKCGEICVRRRDGEWFI